MFARTGLDGHRTLVQFDAANRVSSVTRSEPTGATIMQAAYTYLANGLVDTIVYANGLGATVKYTYDATNRVMVIHHKDILGGPILKLVYSYTTNDLVASLAETGSGSTTTTTFGYDARGRLIHEVRDDFDDARDYDWTYVYDAGGNRLLKHEGPTPANTLQRFEERYEYDVNGNEPKYGTANNRLMKIERWQIDITPGLETKLWTKYYYYSSDGNVLEDEGTIERIVTELPNSNRYTAIRLGYAANERTVTHVLGEEWGGGLPYTVTFARQFRYDGARQRYLNRELDRFKLMENPAVYESLSDTRSDYDGNSIYNDWTFVSPLDVNLRSYEPGLAITDQLAGGGAANTTYLHTNLLGSTMATSTSTGTGTFDAAYTAFGEQIMGQTQRYGFAGEWGYQSHDDFDFMHLGHRYYNPATGRFLQRDPIGIMDGTNVYAYVKANPTRAVDPSGLGSLGGGRWDPFAPPRRPPPSPPSMGKRIKDFAMSCWSTISDVRGLWDSGKDILDLLKGKLPRLRLPGPIPPFFVLPPGITPPAPGEKIIATNCIEDHSGPDPRKQYCAGKFSPRSDWRDAITRRWRRTTVMYGF